MKKSQNAEWEGGISWSKFLLYCGIPSCRGFPPCCLRRNEEVSNGEQDNGISWSKKFSSMWHSKLQSKTPVIYLGLFFLNRTLIVYAIFTMQTISLNFKSSAWFLDHEFALRTPCKIFVQWLVKSIKLISYVTDS
jgi:hypothetical protein